MASPVVVGLHPVAQKVMDVLEQHIERQGFELVAVEYHKGTGRGMLRLMVDRPGGNEPGKGITMSELETVTRSIGDLLDVYDPVESRYTLEVSSPGINRPLTRMSHFEEFRGRRVKVRTHHAHDSRKTFVGKLLEVNANGIEVEDEVSHSRQVVEFGEIKEANYEHQF